MSARPFCANMRRSQLDIALGAAADALKEREFVLVGSQSVHGYTETPPTEVLISEECDVWVKGRFEKVGAIVSTLGKGSPFHDTNGFYVDPVEPGIVLLASGWESRLKPFRVGEVTAWCLDINDLVVSKLNAGRLKDYEFINAMLRARLADFDTVVRRIQTFPDPHQQAVLLARLRISSETMP